MHRGKLRLVQLVSFLNLGTGKITKSSLGNQLFITLKNFIKSYKWNKCVPNPNGVVFSLPFDVSHRTIKFYSSTRTATTTNYMLKNMAYNWIDATTTSRCMLQVYLFINEPIIPMSASSLLSKSATSKSQLGRRSSRLGLGTLF